MKIAIIGSRGYPYVYSGYESFVKELSERLVKKNINVTIYCHKPLFKQRPNSLNGINLIYTPSIELKSLSQFSNSFFSVIHAIFKNYDVLFFVNAANGPFGILTKLFNKKTVINVDGLEWLRPKWKGFGSIYFKFAAKLSTIFFDQIINDAEEMKKIYKEIFSKDSIVIAYGPKTINYKKSNILKKYNLKKLDYFLVVGRLIPDNNWDLIIEGFKLSLTNKKLVIVGDIPFDNDFKKNLIKNNISEKIVFTGLIENQSQVFDLYKNSYAYIHGHEFGGTNPTLVEALSIGNAVIALDTIFNREVLEKSKYKLFFSKNVESVRDIINYSNDNNNIIMDFKNNSTKCLGKKYDWDHITNDYINVFKKLKN